MEEPRYEMHYRPSREYPYRFVCEYRQMNNDIVPITEVEHWCEEHFGSLGPRWMVSSCCSVVHFKREGDAFQFRMRWC